MVRRVFFFGATLLALFESVAPVSATGARVWRIEEASISDIHDAMKRGRLTARELVQMYLKRIEAYDKQGPSLNTIITINPRALRIAEELDRKLRDEGLVGPLHGIPFIVKDNIDTQGMPTTNGVLALKGSIPPDNAHGIRKLKAAGQSFWPSPIWRSSLLLARRR